MNTRATSSLAEAPAAVPHDPDRIAGTKIQPPRPRAPRLLDRPRLTGRLQSAIARHRLVLVQAAAGHGKTTAVWQALSTLRPEPALAWVNLDEGDDIGSVVGSLVAALAPCPLAWPIAPATVVAMAASEDSVRRQHAAMALAIALTDSLEDSLADAPAGSRLARGVIVLDGLHRVDDGALFEFLDGLLDRLGPHWTLVITTRHEAPLSLARLRAWGDVADVDADDLRLDGAEVRALAREAGLDDAAADTLHHRTRGWLTGVQLALQPDGERLLAEYLDSEILATLDSGRRRFLLQASMLNAITPTAAAALTGHPHAAVLIDSVERLDWFADRRRQADDPMRLHPWFRQALQARLRREQPETWEALSRRAKALDTEPPPPVRPVEVHAPASIQTAHTLSPREAEVLALLAAGDSNKHIARALDLSPHTVKRHVANILDKLGARSRVQAAALARQAS